MSTKRDLVITDETCDGHQLTLYKQGDNRIYLEVGDIDTKDRVPEWITLSKTDAIELYNELKNLIDNINT